MISTWWLCLIVPAYIIAGMILRMHYKYLNDKKERELKDAQIRELDAERQIKIAEAAKIQAEAEKIKTETELLK